MSSRSPKFVVNRLWMVVSMSPHELVEGPSARCDRDRQEPQAPVRTALCEVKASDSALPALLGLVLQVRCCTCCTGMRVHVVVRDGDAALLEVGGNLAN